MINIYRPGLCVMVSLIAGCSGGDDRAITDESDRELIFEEQIQSLDKAQAVDQVLQNGADLRRQAIEQQAE